MGIDFPFSLGGVNADGNNQEVNYRITSMKTKNGKKKQFD